MTQRPTFEIPYLDGQIVEMNEYQMRIHHLTNNTNWPGSEILLGKIIRPAGTPSPVFEKEIVKPE